MQRLFLLLAGLVNSELVRQLQFLKVENETLRARVGKQIHTTPEERRRLLKFGLPLGDSVKHLISIVTYGTFLRWVRQHSNVSPKPRGKSGRPRKPEEVEGLVVRLATETGWGYSRILMELKKLGINSISRNTVKNILIRNDLDPGPRRGEGTWDEFIKRHIATLFASDIFSVRVLTLHGYVDYFAVFFLQIGTRRIRFWNLTDHPNGAWMAQQARNFAYICDETDLHPGYLIHDRDSKFTQQFDGIIRSIGCDPKRLPYKSPNLNPYAESWIGTIKRECPPRAKTPNRPISDIEPSCNRLTGMILPV